MSLFKSDFMNLLPDSIDPDFYLGYYLTDPSADESGDPMICTLLPSTSTLIPLVDEGYSNS